MTLLLGVCVSFLVGAGCRFFDIPVPAPPVIPGALLVFAMTVGYGAVDRGPVTRGQVATTVPVCGGPTGESQGARAERAGARQMGGDTKREVRNASYTTGR